MTTVPYQSTLSNITRPVSAIPLPVYAAVIQYTEAAFAGVRKEDELINSACRDIWSKEQRDTVAYYLAEAQQELEDILAYPMMPTYITGLPQLGYDERFVDSQPYNRGMIFTSKWGKVLEAGVRAVATIELVAPIVRTSDPGIVTILNVSATLDTSQVHIYHPGTDVEIIPSYIALSGTTLTIHIPRVRTVLMAQEYNAGPNGLDYDDLTLFESTVDVKRIYTDASTNAVLVRQHGCNSLCSSAGCSEYTQTGCILVEDYAIGILTVRPGTYSDGWTSSGLCYGRPETVRLNYLAGLRDLTPQARDAIIRLAHSKMPNEPCGCDIALRLWKRDRNIPDVATRERINCPFGLSDGAWIAWQWAQTMRLYKGLAI